jgi:hypothetical protein
MKVFCSPTDEILGYRHYLSTKGLNDIELVPSVEQDFVTLVKSSVAPNVSEYTIEKILEMHACFSGPGKDGGVYIVEQVGFTDQALEKIKELNGSFFVPLTMGTVYKALPNGKQAETNFFGQIDCFVYSAEFAKKFTDNVDFRQPFDVVAMSMLPGSPPYKFVPVAERMSYNSRKDDTYEGYWSSFLRGYQPTCLSYSTMESEYADFVTKKLRVEEYYKNTYGLPTSVVDIRYIKERYEAIKELVTIIEQEECESSSPDPQVSSEAT